MRTVERTVSVTYTGSLRKSTVTEQRCSLLLDLICFEQLTMALFQTHTATSSRNPAFPPGSGESAKFGHPPSLIREKRLAPQLAS